MLKDMRRSHALAFAAATCLAGIALVRVAIGEPDATKPKVEAPASAGAPAPVATAATASTSPQAKASAPTEAAPIAAASANADAAPSSFAEAMKSTDPFVRREAIENAVAANDVSALPALLQVDLTQNGYVAASAIEGVGKLAALLPPGERGPAVRTLARWMGEENGRDAQEAKGNVSIAVDALGDTKSQEAIAPLVAALDSAKYPLHIETRIVEKLDALDARAAAPSIARFAARAAAIKPSDDLERELALEAVQTANAVLAKWGP